MKKFIGRVLGLRVVVLSLFVFLFLLGGVFVVSVNKTNAQYLANVGMIHVSSVDPSGNDYMRGTSVKIDNTSLDAVLSPTNSQVSFPDITEGAHRVYITDLFGYDEYVAQCTDLIFLSGYVNSLCAPTASSYSKTGVTCDGRFCSVSATMRKGNDSKVFFKYVPTTTTPKSPKPTVQLSASSVSISSGQNVTLTWSSTNSTSCLASGAWTGAKTVSGTQTVTPAVNNTTYALACGGSQGMSLSVSVTVNVGSGSIRVYRLDKTGIFSYDHFISGTQGKVGTLATTATNPALFINLPPTSNVPSIAYATDLPGYDEYVSQCSASSLWPGTCTVDVASYSKTNVTCANSLCSVPVEVIGDRIANVFFKYVPINTTPTSVSVTPSNKFTVNDMVKVIGNALNVRNTPSISATLSTTPQNTPNPQPVNAGGKIVNPPSGTNPTFANDYWWWYVNYDSGADGWSVENYLTKYVSNPTSTSVNPTSQLSAYPLSITAGQSSTLTWSSTNFSECTASGGWTGSKSVSAGTHTEIVSPTENTTYYLNCSNPGTSTYTARSYVTVMVTPASAGTNNNNGSGNSTSGSISGGTTAQASGSVLIRQRNNENDNVPEAQAKIDGTLLSNNPAIISGLSTGSHTVYTTNVPGYEKRAGICSYPIGGTECTNYAGVSVTCADICSVPINVNANTVTKILFVYSPTYTPAAAAPVTTVLPWTGPSSVAAGSALSYTLNWNAVPMDKSWSTFVHFVKSDNQNVLFGDGFWPSPATTQWSGNVSVGHTFTVPTGTVPGTYKVMAGLYNNDGRNTALSAGAGVSVDSQYRYQVGTITITANTSQTPTVWNAFDWGAFKALFSF